MRVVPLTVGHAQLCFCCLQERLTAAESDITVFPRVECAPQLPVADFLRKQCVMCENTVCSNHAFVSPGSAGFCKHGFPGTSGPRSPPHLLCRPLAWSSLRQRLPLYLGFGQSSALRGVEEVTEEKG